MDAEYELLVDAALDPCPARVALIWAEGLDSVAPTECPFAELGALLERVRRTGESPVAEERRAQVRRMLRHGTYRPSGRGKPASEFLVRAALADEFPLVNAPVDVNNAISLESGLPGSIFDAARTGRRLLLRWGRDGERYTFNPAGQTIDLRDLLLVCRREGDAWIPCGNPVKDAMGTKVGSETRDVIAVLYAPREVSREELQRWADRYTALLMDRCAAQRAGTRIIDGHREGP
jgi:DNA/RNA-binding domain of Phe-tRNA-synthetase-like protein